MTKKASFGLSQRYVSDPRPLVGMKPFIFWFVTPQMKHWQSRWEKSGFWPRTAGQKPFRNWPIIWMIGCWFIQTVFVQLSHSWGQALGSLTLPLKEVLSESGLVLDRWLSLDGALPESQILLRVTLKVNLKRNKCNISVTHEVKLLLSAVLILINFFANIEKVQSNHERDIRQLR